MRVISLFLVAILQLVASPDLATGECTKGNCKNGVGTMQYQNGVVYEGGFKDGKRDGDGKYTNPAGIVYVGEFKNNHFSGKDKMTHIDGRVYEGEFKESNFDGEGVYIWGDGAKYSGSFKAGDFFTGEFVAPDGTKRLYNEGKRVE